MCDIFLVLSFVGCLFVCVCACVCVFMGWVWVQGKLNDMDQELSSVLSDFKKLDKRISKVATTAVSKMRVVVVEGGREEKTEREEKQVNEEE